jgi:subtilisin family serine protease
MKRMKWVALLLAMALSLTGCGGQLSQNVNATDSDRGSGRWSNIRNTLIGRLQEKGAYEKLVIETDGELNTASIEENLPGSVVIPLSDGSYVVYSDQNSTADMEVRLKKIRGIRKVIQTLPIDIIKPVEKVKVGSDFIIGGIDLNDDGAVNDPGYKSQWALAYTEASKSWSLLQQSKTVMVAVLDTGVDYTHPDLNSRVLTQLGYDFVDNDADPMDENGHGTHVAGIIAAEANNGIGITGIAGTLDVKIIPIRVLDANGSGSSDKVARGIEYAVAQGADIINLSLGGQGVDSVIDNAISYALEQGVFVAAAAGNENQNADGYTPAGTDGVYTVAAINPRRLKASFSNYGNCVEISSPGTKILSTVLGGGYEAWDGTSMAAPLVSGAAAILKACDASLTPAEISVLLSAHTSPFNEKEKGAIGTGIVDVYAALASMNIASATDAGSKNAETSSVSAVSSAIFDRKPATLFAAGLQKVHQSDSYTKTFSHTLANDSGKLLSLNAVSKLSKSGPAYSQNIQWTGAEKSGSVKLYGEKRSLTLVRGDGSTRTFTPDADFTKNLESIDEHLTTVEASAKAQALAEMLLDAFEPYISRETTSDGGQKISLTLAAADIENGKAAVKLAAQRLVSGSGTVGLTMDALAAETDGRIATAFSGIRETVKITGLSAVASFTADGMLSSYSVQIEAEGMRKNGTNGSFTINNRTEYSGINTTIPDKNQ